MKVLLTDKIDSRAGDLLRRKGFDAVDVDTLPATSLQETIKSYDVIVIRSATKLCASILRDAGRLKLIVRGGVGVDNVDLDAATDAGIAVANTPGANMIATAELTFSLLLASARNIPHAHNSVQSKKWERSSFCGIELADKTLGIVGFGRIGREVAKRALAFGMRVIAYDPYLTTAVFREMKVEQVAPESIFKEADFITLHTPVTSDTRNIIGEAALKLMKPAVRIINCARGGLIDEKAAVKALQAGRIGGLAFDVYEQEPVAADSILLGDNRIITLPHLGASTQESQAKIADEVVQVILGFYNKSNVETILNPDTLINCKDNRC